MVTSLWGDIEKLPEVKTPRVILLEQAELLKDGTSGLLVAEVYSGGTDTPGETEISVDILARSLNNYRVRIIDCRYGREYYPADLYNEEQNKWSSQMNADDFESALSGILQSNRVRMIIGGLISEMKATGREIVKFDKDIPF